MFTGLMILLWTVLCDSSIADLLLITHVARIAALLTIFNQLLHRFLLLSIAFIADYKECDQLNDDQHERHKKFVSVKVLYIFPLKLWCCISDVINDVINDVIGGSICGSIGGSIGGVSLAENRV